MILTVWIHSENEKNVWQAALSLYNNSMKFIFEKESEKSPTFNQVEENQFFVNANGKLCQKVSSTTYNVIADKDGVPFTVVVAQHINGLNKIKKILPKVVKIEF